MLKISIASPPMGPFRSMFNNLKTAIMGLDAVTFPYLYFGDKQPTEDGCWRITVDDGDCVIQKRENGGWATKETIP